jgi:hypothetical protein
MGGEVSLVEPMLLLVVFLVVDLLAALFAAETRDGNDWVKHPRI